MISANWSSQWVRIALLVVLVVAFASANASATPITLYVRYQDYLTGYSGDPAQGDMEVGPWQGLSSFRVTQDGTTISITDLTITGDCLDQQCPSSYTFIMDAEAFVGFRATDVILTVDGSASTSNEAGISISTGIVAWVTDPSEQSFSLSAGISNINGGFSGSWDRAKDKAYVISDFQWTVGIGGIMNGDTVNLPGSFGLDLYAPPPEIPEPATLLLLGTGLGALGLAAWRRRK